jgi:hypothetical protein
LFGCDGSVRNLRQSKVSKFSGGAGVSGVLPDKTLPDVESALVEHLAENSGFSTSRNIALLIERYATPAALEARVAGYLDPSLGKIACDVQTLLKSPVLLTNCEVLSGTILCYAFAA